MDNPLWTATLVSTSPRYKEWHRILGGDAVPLLDPKTYHADFAKDERDVEIHKLDWQGLNSMQKNRLIEWVCKKFSVTRAQSSDELNQRGFPIRAADVSIAISYRAIL